MKRILILLLGVLVPVAGIRAQNQSGDMMKAAAQAFQVIPDHAKVSVEARQYMTEELYEALSTAWDIPCREGEIGDEEFLVYFLTGNGGSEVGPIEGIELTYYDADSFVADVYYREMWGNTADDELSDITLCFKSEDGQWLLDDFGDDTKSDCVDYILSEVAKFLFWKTFNGQHDDYWFTQKYDAEMLACIETHKDFLGEIATIED